VGDGDGVGETTAAMFCGGAHANARTSAAAKAAADLPPTTSQNTEREGKFK
jgi:hypothetical protein